MDTFVEKYMNKCISEGIKNPTDMCKKALKEIEALDVELEKLYELRMKKKQLKDVLKTFNHESLKKPRTNNIEDFISPELLESSSDPYYSNLIQDIVKFIKENKDENVTSREIVAHISTYDESDNVYAAIKWLCEKGVITKDGRIISKGPCWDDN